MRILYHFAASPFSRRTRLALAHKSLACELRDGRENRAWLADARGAAHVRTIPVLVDGGHALGDSTAITRWLDAAYPETLPAWPGGDDTLAVVETASLVDVALNHIIDIGMRYYPLRHDPAWKGVKEEMLGRAQRALDGLADRARALARPTFAKSGWSAADMWLYTAVAWVEALPGRAAHNANVAQILEVGGWTLPPVLAHWADPHRDRVEPLLRA